MAEAGIRVRPAAMADYPAAETIMEQVHALHVGWRPDVYRPCAPVLSQAWYQELINTDCAFVAEVNGRVAGILHVCYRHVEGESSVTRDLVFADVIAVDEPYRGQGIGRALVEHMRRIRDEKHLDGIMLQVNARNQEAMHMYEHCGFAPCSINMELKD